MHPLEGLYALCFSNSLKRHLRYLFKTIQKSIRRQPGSVTGEAAFSQQEAYKRERKKSKTERLAAHFNAKVLTLSGLDWRNCP